MPARAGGAPKPLLPGDGPISGKAAIAGNAGVAVLRSSGPGAKPGGAHTKAAGEDALTPKAIPDGAGDF